MRVAIVGGGAVGFACAHALADEGHVVEVVDRGVPEAAASTGNAGWMAHMDILPLASPKAWANMPRWMLDPLGPLSISPSYFPRLVPWLVRFTLASRPSRIAHGAAAIHALNALAMPAWNRCAARSGVGGLFRNRGILSVWNRTSDFEAAAGLHARQSALGIAVERLDAAAVRRLEPAFGPEIVGGAFYETGLHVSDPRAVVDTLRAEARARGITITVGDVTRLRSKPEAVAVELSSGSVLTADRVVIAAGAWSKRLAADVGDRVPLDTERGYNITVAPGTLGLSRPVMYEGLGFVTTPLDIGDRIGGSVEFAGLDAAPNWRRVDAMLGRLKRALPHAKVEYGVRWMGFRPSIPDSLPVIGRASGDARVVHAFGHGHYGLTQAAATAEIVAAILGDRAAPLDPTPYAASRF
ncbi:amino acid oxidase [Prosthecomicrobium hirschii]|nr:amino acid oxidase [Prosthecomicrobium hirschii]